MPTYMIGHFDIVDEAAYEDYARKAGPLVSRHRGTIIVGDKDVRPLEGPKPGMILVISFPGEADAMAFYDDPDYQRVRPIRLDATANHSVVLSVDNDS